MIGVSRAYGPLLRVKMGTIRNWRFPKHALTVLLFYSSSIRLYPSAFSVSSTKFLLPTPLLKFF